MRTLVIGDIHGSLKALKQLLKKAQVTEQDALIFLGDYVDGWSESSYVIRFLIQLSKTHTCTFIKGNHDAWCENWLKNNEVLSVWYNHGGKETIDSYTTISDAEKKEHLSFLESMKMYFIDDANRLFVHAGFTSMHGPEKEHTKTNLFYDRTLWEMALALDENLERESAFYPKRLNLFKEIYIGHTPTIIYDCFEPMKAVNVWNIDTGAAFFGKLSCINVSTKQVYQTDVVRELHPNEMGRNKT